MTETHALPSDTTTDLPRDVARFPYPFEADTFAYRTNIETARVPISTLGGGWGETILNVEPDHADRIAQRARILATDPTRYRSLEHLAPAQWDAAVVLLRELAACRPDAVTFTLDGRRAHLTNRLSGIDRGFTIGDPDTLDEPPLVFAARQIGEDVVLLDQYGDDLRIGAGVVTFATHWSFPALVGASFENFHRPVPRVIENGVIPRALDFLLRLSPGEWVRRINFSLGVDGLLDLSVENHDEWKPARAALVDADPDELGARFNLRVEIQHLLRLAPSGTILFTIDYRQLPLDRLLLVPEWARRFVAVVETLPDDIADYKGFLPLRPAIDRWWRARSAGQSQGGHPGE
ncbi:heme-dependent oxidative N-demethylase subunit alpha family protein [Millisia brevis]|uniref:heme-dependent oxidative N-demethylase subunit alpha family protein n=1 Tax=Millisia brevis TaxID=264148 RepID=UPI00083710ED|nr:heme-dependent oxidative N-demethylase subunit alpha family protein [Millisia brevis]